MKIGLLSCDQKLLNNGEKILNSATEQGLHVFVSSSATYAFLEKVHRIRAARDKVPEIIESGPLCITEFLLNKSVAYSIVMSSYTPY